MASINQVNALGTVYDIEDAAAQQSITAIQGDIAEITTDLGNKAPLIEPTAGPADVATFTDGAAGMPMEVTVALDPIQAGSGDPAPDNVRPISGHSSVDVHHTGSTLSVTFPTPPGTVYGGTLTVNRDGTGKLVVDRGYYAFDGSEDWDTLANAENLYYLNAQSYGNFADVYLNATANDFAISNRYVQRTYAGIISSQNGQFAIGSPSATSISRRIYVKDTACATVDDLKASLATTPLQLVFRINTPITYDLTTEQVGQLMSVKGPNNIWSAGQVEVKYAADTKLYIDGKIASLQATILENISNA